MKQKDIFYNTYSMLNIMPYISIQVNESIAKFFTLIIKGSLEQRYGV
jgi:hypothetical protein